MTRNILIAALAALCASPVAAYEIEPVFIKSWSTSGAAENQGGLNKEALRTPLTGSVPSSPSSGAFFLKNSNENFSVGQPIAPPLKTVPPATPAPHSNGAIAALLHDGSVRFNPVGKPGAIAGTAPRR